MDRIRKHSPISEEVGRNIDTSKRRCYICIEEKRPFLEDEERFLLYYMFQQFGGPDGELAASMRYLSQRYTMPYKEVTGILTDIGTEELAHMEMICAIVHQLTRNLSVEEVEKYGFDKYYVDHTLALWPQAASGAPWTATYFQSKGDPITDLHEDMAAEGATS